MFLFDLSISRNEGKSESNKRVSEGKTPNKSE
jgi:hypothetical protein